MQVYKTLLYWGLWCIMVGRDSKETEISCVKTISEASCWLLEAVMLGEEYFLGRGKS